MSDPAAFWFHPRCRATLAAALCSSAFLVLGACNKSNDSPPPPSIPTTPDPVVGDHDSLPGVVVAITGISGGSGANGNFQPGDTITVTFTVKRNDGVPLELSLMDRGAIMVSGPTSNYQRVIAPVLDVRTRAVKTAVDTYTYTFASPIPATYLAPINDTTALTAGEMTGLPLQSGTYTVGIELLKNYTVEGTVYHDAGMATKDFLLGDATALEPREVVTTANCNQCHKKLTVHTGKRNDVKNCVLCHTAGSEDFNTPTVANGTPGVTLEFKVMIHKIHAAAHLPSVLGVATNANGSRNYAATPQPLLYMDDNDAIEDFSDHQFPVWPNFTIGMPRDIGYSSLAPAEQALEDAILKGPVACAKCHGDPDGAGPLPAPANGSLIYAQPSRRACGACHDDINWSYPYTSNQQTMPPQPNDAVCKDCHAPEDIQAAHTHPLKDPTVANGVKFVVTSVTDANGNSNGKLDPGERVQITFRVEDNDGNPIAASSLGRIEAVLSGPTTNPQAMNYQRMDPLYFSGNGPYTVNMPDQVFYEPVGTSTSASLQTFTTALAPHWATAALPTTVLIRFGTGVSTTLSAGAVATQNYIDVASAAGIVKDDYIVIDDGSATNREYMKVQWVQGNRLWFGSRFRTSYKPNLLKAHASGVSVQVVTVATIPDTSYTLTASTGQITETSEFGNGEVLVSYTSDWIFPSVYPGALDDSPVNGQDWGDWTGLPIVDGTYTFDMHGYKNLTVNPTGLESTSYREGASPTVVHVLVGSATEVHTVSRIEGSSTCYACHDDIQFHGGTRRGFEACINCHGSAGTEDKLLYEDPTAGHPLGTTLEYRNFLHAAHDNVFPAMPGGVQRCRACHGDANTAWKSPADRMHPSQTTPTRAWKVVCSSCHTSTLTAGHIDAMTSPSGYETCALCHGESKMEPVELVHLPR
ncbi:MAG: hypothetical protein Fur0037_01460 [Planctomycetota bacterium]